MALLKYFLAFCLVTMQVYFLNEYIYNKTKNKSSVGRFIYLRLMQLMSIMFSRCPLAEAVFQVLAEGWDRGTDKEKEEQHHLKGELLLTGPSLCQEALV